MSRIIHVLISIILLSVVASCGSQNVTETSIQSVGVDAAKELVAQDESVVVLDVRTPEEYEAGHIQGALNINIRNENFSNMVSMLDRNKTYMVHCSANVDNGRTDKSLKIMNNLGFKKLLDMSGGIVAWTQRGNPVVQETDKKAND